MLFRNTSHSTLLMHGPRRRFTGFPPSIAPVNSLASIRAIHILHNASGKEFSLPIVSNTLRGELFRETGFRGRGGGAPSVPGNQIIPVAHPSRRCRSTTGLDGPAERRGEA